MKYFVFVFLCFSFFSIAQHKIMGNLKDQNNQPVYGCAIKLNQKNVLVKSTLSDENGKFSIENVENGQYMIEIVSVFYEIYTKEINLVDDLSLGDILLSEKVSEIDEITITKTQIIKPTDTGVILNVADTRLRNQSSLLDVLSYAPSVSMYNGLRIFGSDNVRVLLDGKEIRVNKDKITNFLNTINPLTIQNIEIIDRVDASVSGDTNGIIAITTIQKNGWNGLIKQNISYNEKLGTSTNLALFYQEDSFRIFGDYDMFRKKTSYKEYERQIRENQYSYYQTGQGTLDRKGDYVTFGADYFFSQDSNLSFLYLFEDDKDANHKRNLSTQIITNTSIDSLLTTQNRFDQIDKMHSFSLLFNSDLDSLGSTLNIGFDIALKMYDNPYHQKNSYQNNTDFSEEQNIQNSSDNNNVYAFEVSWKNKLKKNRELSIGTKISLVDNQNQYDYFDLQSGQWTKNTNFSNDFSFKEYLVSAFSNFSSPLGEKSKISVGLRSEYNYNDYSNQTIEGNNDNYRILPNVLYSLGGFYFQASQRIAARPRYYLFNPKYVKSSPTDAYTGNENLKPIDNYRLLAGYRFKNNLQINFLYSYSENNIIIIPTNNNGVLVTRPENAGYQNNMYLLTYYPYKIANWWQTYTNVQLSSVDYKFFNQKYTSLQGYFQLKNIFELIEDTELEISYSYQTANKYLYIKTMEQNQVNLSFFYPLSQSFRLYFSVEDVFDSSRNRTTYDFNNIYDYSYSKHNTRTFNFMISYNFTKGKEVDQDVRNSGIDDIKNRF